MTGEPERAVAVAGVRPVPSHVVHAHLAIAVHRRPRRREADVRVERILGLGRRPGPAARLGLHAERRGELALVLLRVVARRQKEALARARRAVIELLLALPEACGSNSVSSYECQLCILRVPMHHHDSLCVA